ncbi:hypothetical protein H0901_22085 [Microcystis aeruginosa BLCCF158]|uniref:Uncharacterized protein n=1 Tax=Microcystis aeruginosa BLCC-F158 TaxID=2755316 RepID=A0A841V6X7_MICAE|nr:hypothetical protein [Microcystis aeruginosa]MBC1197865.1 hypothetical protein [Microcystis aeruginosa BLCC-F158]
MAISSEWQFVKSFLRKTYNREVNEFFRDIDPNQIPENTNGRNSAKRSCLIMPNDSQNMCLIKKINFYFNFHKAHLKLDVYGVPIDSFQEEVTFRPIIQLFFRQDNAAVPDDLQPLRAQISLRLMGETSQSITKSKLIQIGNKIKTELATGRGFVWSKGKLKRVCKDSENGLNLNILCINEREGTEIIKKIYEVLSLSYDENNCTTVNPERNSVNIPGNQTILRKTVKKKRWRPTGNVRFTHAVALIHGLSTSVVLVDRTGRYSNVFTDPD